MALRAAFAIMALFVALCAAACGSKGSNSGPCQAACGEIYTRCKLTLLDTNQNPIPQGNCVSLCQKEGPADQSSINDCVKAAACDETAIDACVS